MAIHKPFAHKTQHIAANVFSAAIRTAKRLLAKFVGLAHVPAESLVIGYPVSVIFSHSLLRFLAEVDLSGRL